MRVPVDWDSPQADSFEIALARRTAPAGERVGTLVFGPGGPGDSGVERVGTGFSRFSPQVRRRFDIVSFDPRGVGRSGPVTCSPELLARRPSPVMTSQADFDATVAYNRKLRADCRANTKPARLFDHLDTGQTVRDLEAVRRALGERQLTFHGSSYGTVLGAQYAEAYPRNVRAMVLESVMDHSVPTTRAFLADGATAAQDLFDEFAARQDRDVRAAWHRLLARADRGELATPPRLAPRIGPRITRSDLVNLVAFRAFYQADFTTLAADIADLETRVPGGPPPTLSPLPPAAPVFCADWRLPVRDYEEYARLVRTMSGAAPDLPGLLPLRMTAACLGAPTANPQHRLRPGRGTPPILLVNAAHDPATPHAWAASVARQFGRAGVLLTYDGHGHGSATNGPCMTAAVDAYLIHLRAPARGSHCPALG